ncbi:MAG: hypothetical protein K2Y51_24055 [Gammaproteobacteria bacterium]|nr:hypothetical protein [Gammaproteobacteria bacterium]
MKLVASTCLLVLLLSGARDDVLDVTGPRVTSRVDVSTLDLAAQRHGRRAGEERAEKRFV